MVFECAVQVPAARIENSIRLTQHWGAFSVKPDHNGSNSLFFSLLQSNLRGKLVGSVGEQIGALSCIWYTHTNKLQHTHTHTDIHKTHTTHIHASTQTHTHIPQTVTKMIHAYTQRSAHSMGAVLRQVTSYARIKAGDSQALPPQISPRSSVRTALSHLWDTHTHTSRTTR